MTALLVLLCALQAGEAIDLQVKRIDGADPRASFDAVGRLMTVSLRNRGMVKDAVAAVKDPFYREVLQSELDLRERLGDRYGMERRMSVAAGLPANAYLDRLEKAGVRARPHYVDAFSNEEAVDLAMNDATVLDVLSELCRKTAAGPHADGAGRANLWPRQGPDFAACPFRNFLVQAGDVRRTEVVDFSGPPKRGVVLELAFLWDQGVEVASVAPTATILEAVDEKGAPLAPADPGLLPALEEQDAPRREVNLSTPSGRSIAFAPTASTKVARLRGYLTVRVAVETSEFVFPRPAMGGAMDDAHFVVKLTGVAPFETQVGGAADTQLGLRVIPKEATAEEYRSISVQVAGVVPDDKIPFWGGGRFHRGEASYEGLAVTGRQAVTSLVVKIHRRTAERRVYFDLRNIPLEK